MDLTLLQAETEEDIASLADMASRIWFEYFVSIISKEQIEYMVEKFQSVADIGNGFVMDDYAMEKKIAE